MRVTDFDQFISLHQPKAVGGMRQKMEDFKVTENLGFPLADNGSHLWLYIEKRDLNTASVAQKIAQYFCVKIANIGYSGLKDKRAVSQQWFSVPYVSEIGDLAGLENQQMRVLSAKKHCSKLKRGTHKSNTFELVVRDIQGEIYSINQTLEQIATAGVPNYFGPQRFGKNNYNVEQALKVFEGQLSPDRSTRGIYLSAARSYLFNLILAKRVEQETWDKAMVGDAMSLEGSNSYFICEQVDEDITKRLAEKDIHPSGAMWGKGELATKYAIAMLEQSIANLCAPLVEGLCQQGLKQGRRALRLMPQEFAYQWQDKSILRLNFTLPKGAFATSLLREIVRIQP